MEPLLISTGLVAMAEMGDRTQLLAVLLAARFRRPWSLIGGIAAGALANHLLAALAGYYLASLLDTPWFHILIALSFIGMGVWTLLEHDPGEVAERATGQGAFLTAATAVFVLEMGDKTQLATAALAARFHDVFLVTLGSTLGMLITSAPAVLAGEGVTRIAPLRVLRIAGAAVYIVLGLAALARIAGLRL